MKLCKIADKKPEADMTKCFVVVRKTDGSYCGVYYPVSYTTGLEVNGRTTVGFPYHSVTTWMHWPKHFVEDRSGWTPTAEKYPNKNGSYFVSLYSSLGRKNVIVAGYDEKHEHFYGCDTDDIAWMPMPQGAYL